MGLQDSLILGALADEIDQDDTQIEINEESLYNYDKQTLYENIKNRISKYDLEFYFEQIPDTDINYWMLILQQMIKVYHLNSLKVFLPEGFITDDLSKHIINLVYFIKYILLTSDKEISISLDRESIRNILEELKCPKLVLYFIMLTDNESLKLFLKRIVYERGVQNADI